MQDNVGRVGNLMRRVNPEIDSILGNLSDIVVKKNFTDALGLLTEYKKKKDERKKFSSISGVLGKIELSPEELLKPRLDEQGAQQWGYTGNIDLNEKDPNDPNKFANEEVEAYFDLLKKKNEEEYGKLNEELPEDPAQWKIKQGDYTFDQYVRENEAIQKSLRQKGYIEDLYDDITDEEFKGKLYSKAGLSPEDIMFYEGYKDRMTDAEDHNEKIARLVLEQQPGLISKGELKDYYAQLFGQQASTLLMDKEVPEEDPLSKSSPKDWRAIKGADGKYYWYADYYDKNSRSWRSKKVREMNQDEVKDKFGDKKQPLGKIPATEVYKMSYEDVLSKYTADEILDNYDYFNPDVKQKIKENPQFSELIANIEQKKIDKLSKSSRKSPRYSSKGKGKSYQSELLTLGKIGMKYKGTDWREWSEEDQQAYTDAMNIAIMKSGKTQSEIEDEVGQLQGNEPEEDEDIQSAFKDRDTRDLSEYEEEERENVVNIEMKDVNDYLTALEEDVVNAIQNGTIGTFDINTAYKEALNSFNGYSKYALSYLTSELNKLIKKYSSGYSGIQ